MLPSKVRKGLLLVCSFVGVGSGLLLILTQAGWIIWIDVPMNELMGSQTKSLPNVASNIEARAENEAKIKIQQIGGREFYDRETRYLKSQFGFTDDKVEWLRMSKRSYGTQRVDLEKAPHSNAQITELSSKREQELTQAFGGKANYSKYLEFDKKNIEILKAFFAENGVSMGPVHYAPVAGFNEVRKRNQ